MNADERIEEVTYCLALVRTHGNADVPHASVASYLETQAVGFTQDKCLPAAAAFRAAAAFYRDRKYTAAYEALPLFCMTDQTVQS